MEMAGRMRLVLLRLEVTLVEINLVRQFHSGPFRLH